MAVIKRYEAAADRARLLYRIPTAPNGNRTLELFHSGAPLLADCDWPGHTKTMCRIGPSKGSAPGTHEQNDADLDSIDFRKPLPFANQAFDLVIVHRTLDDLAALATGVESRFDPVLFFKRVSVVLATEGVIAGCVSNRWSLKSLGGRLRNLAGSAQGAPPSGYFTLHSLRKGLVSAGYTGIRLFTLLPNCAAPSRLIDTDPAISRAAFRHEFDISRHTPFTPGYFARVAMVELGLNRHLEEAIFFWAIKPC